MLSAHRWAVELQQSAPLEHAIDDGGREVVVVQHAAPAIGMFVRCEDHGAPRLMALRDDVVEHVRGIVAVGQVAGRAPQIYAARDVRS